MDQDALRAEVDRLVDRAAIEDLFSQFAAGTDVHDWDLAAACFTPDVVLDLSNPIWDGTKDTVWVGFDEVLDNLERGISRHFVGHHMITNVRSSIDRDTARAVAYLRSSHLDDPAQPTVHEDHGAWYLTQLRRVDGGWRFTYLKPISVWWTAESGDGPLSRERLAEMRDFLAITPNPPQSRAGSARGLDADVRRLADREAIIDLFSRFTGAADVQDWDAQATCFAPDIVIDRSRATWDGYQEHAWVGRDQVMEHIETDSSKHFLSHHMVTNHRIVIDGNAARAVAYLHSVHVDDPQRPDDHYAHGAWYLAEARRDGEWRFTYLKHIPVWWPAALRPAGPATEGQLAEMRDFLDVTRRPHATRT